MALVALTLVLAACSDIAGSASTNTTNETTASTTAPATTTQPGDGTSSSTAGATGTTSGRPLAPEFTLVLGDGGTYTLSEGAKPVYLVFWAEW